jgi:hypothetical protein
VAFFWLETCSPAMFCSTCARIRLLVITPKLPEVETRVMA